MKYVNIVQKDSVDYEIQDSRIPQPELEDEGKALIVNDEGAYELKDISVDAYTKAETDSLLAEKADANDVYDKSAVDSLLADKQDVLVSGQNIKTINSESLLGNTDIALPTIADVAAKQDALTAGENVSIENNVISAQDTTYSAGTGLTLEGTEFAINDEVVAVKTDLESKQDTLVSGENIKTVNNESLLGEGNIEISSGIDKVDSFKDIAIEANEGKIYQYTGLDTDIIDSVKYADRFDIDVDPDTFAEKVEYTAGDYIFTYSNEEWDKDLEEYGITFESEDLRDGDAFTVSYKDGIIRVDDQITKLYWGEKSTIDFTPLFKDGSGTQVEFNDNWSAYVGSTSGCSVSLGGYRDVYINAIYPGNVIGLKYDTKKFIYDKNSSTWSLDGVQINLSQIGINVSDIDTSYDEIYFNINTNIGIKFNGKYINIVEGYDGDSNQWCFTALDTGDLILTRVRTNGSGEAYLDFEGPMFTINSGWDMYRSTMLFQHYIDAVPFVITSVTKQDIWRNYISKVSIPAISVIENLIPRVELTVDTDVVKEYVTTEKPLELVYREGEWCSKYVSEGTSISNYVPQESGGEYDSIYFNTFLSQKDTDKIFAEFPFSSDGGSGGSSFMPFKVSDAGDSTVTQSHMANALGGYLIVIMDENAHSGSEMDMIYYNSIDMYSMYFGVGKGWLKDRYVLPANSWKIELNPEADVTLFDEFMSLTPYEMIYEPINLEDYGITCEGDVEEGDSIIVKAEANGLEKFELYRIDAEEQKPEINVGDTISTIYFNTDYTPTLKDLSIKDLMQITYHFYFGNVYSDGSIMNPGLFAFVYSENGIDESGGIPEGQIEIALGKKLNQGGGSGSGSLDPATMFTMFMSQEDVIYTSVAIPQYSLNAGWVTDAVTYEEPFELASSAVVYEQVFNSSENIELAKAYTSSIPFNVEPEVVYVPVKFYLSPSDIAKIDVSSVVDLGQVDIEFPASSSSQATIMPTDEQMNVIKNALKNNQIPAFKFTVVNHGSQLNFVVPYVAGQNDPSYPEEDRYFFKSADTEGLTASIELYANYNGMGFALGDIELSMGGGSSSGVSSIEGVSGDIYLGSYLSMNGNTLTLSTSNNSKYLRQKYIRVKTLYTGSGYDSVQFGLTITLGDNDNYSFSSYSNLYSFLSEKGVSIIYGLTGTVSYGSNFKPIESVQFESDGMTISYFASGMSGDFNTSTVHINDNVSVTSSGYTSITYVKEVQ